MIGERVQEIRLFGGEREPSGRSVALDPSSAPAAAEDEAAQSSLVVCAEPTSEPPLDEHRDLLSYRLLDVVIGPRIEDGLELVAAVPARHDDDRPQVAAPATCA